jgi:hypothetical protein
VVAGAAMGMNGGTRGFKALLGSLGGRAGGGWTGLKDGTGGGKSGSCIGVMSQEGEWDEKLWAAGVTSLFSFLCGGSMNGFLLVGGKV